MKGKTEGERKGEEGKGEGEQQRFLFTEASKKSKQSQK